MARLPSLIGTITYEPDEQRIIDGLILVLTYRPGAATAELAQPTPPPAPLRKARPSRLAKWEAHWQAEADDQADDDALD